MVPPFPRTSLAAFVTLLMAAAAPAEPRFGWITAGDWGALECPEARAPCQIHVVNAPRNFIQFARDGLDFTQRLEELGVEFSGGYAIGLGPETLLVRAPPESIELMLAPSMPSWRVPAHDTEIGGSAALPSAGPELRMVIWAALAPACERAALFEAIATCGAEVVYAAHLSELKMTVTLLRPGTNSVPTLIECVAGAASP